MTQADGAEDGGLKAGEQPSEHDQKRVFDNAWGFVHRGGEEIIGVIDVVCGKQTVVVRSFDGIQRRLAQQDEQEDIERAQKGEADPFRRKLRAL